MENTGEAIWKSFSEKGIVLAGIDGPEYQAFFQSLVRVSQTSRAGFRVLDGVENVQDGDYVLLFARPTIAEHLPSAQKKRSGAAARRRREAGKKKTKTGARRLKRRSILPDGKNHQDSGSRRARTGRRHCSFFLSCRALQRQDRPQCF